MSKNTIFGISLIVAGAAMLGYGEFSYKTQEKVIEVGPITATAETTKTVALPPVIGWALVGGGILVLVLGVIPRRV